MPVTRHGKHDNGENSPAWAPSASTSRSKPSAKNSR